MDKIQLSHVTYRYHERQQEHIALHDINLSIPEGEFVSIVGQSGCGKTTLIRLISGLAMPSEGTVMIDGVKVTGPASNRAVVFQEYTLFPWMTACQNIEFGIRQADRGKKRQEAHKIALHYLERVGMLASSNLHPYQMSGGMRQRVAIARALAMDPEILLLDEPFGALDIKLRTELQTLLEELWQEDGGRRRTILFVTHDIHEAVLLADRVIYMVPGRIQADIAVPVGRPRMSLCDCDNDRICAIRRELKAMF